MKNALKIKLDQLVRDYDLELLSSSGSLILASTSGSSNPENITLSLAAGTYYIRVFGFAGANGPETVS